MLSKRSKRIYKRKGRKRYSRRPRSSGKRYRSSADQQKEEILRRGAGIEKELAKVWKTRANKVSWDADIMSEWLGNLMVILEKFVSMYRKRIEQSILNEMDLRIVQYIRTGLPLLTEICTHFGHQKRHNDKYETVKEKARKKYDEPSDGHSDEHENNPAVLWSDLEIHKLQLYEHILNFINPPKSRLWSKKPRR